MVDYALFFQIDFEFVAGVDFFDQAFGGFDGDEIAAVYAVAEEDSGIELGNHTGAPRFGEREGSVFAAGAAAEIFSADDDLEIAFEFVFADESDVPVGETGLRRPGRCSWRTCRRIFVPRESTDYTRGTSPG